MVEGGIHACILGSTPDHFTWLTPQQQQRRSHHKPPLTGSLPNLLLFPYPQTQVITYLLCSPPSRSDCLDSPHLLQQAVPLCQRSGSPHCWSQIPGTIPHTQLLLPGIQCSGPLPRPASAFPLPPFTAWPPCTFCPRCPSAPVSHTPSPTGLPCASCVWHLAHYLQDFCLGSAPQLEHGLCPDSTQQCPEHEGQLVEYE